MQQKCIICKKGYISHREQIEQNNLTNEQIDVHYDFCSNVLCDWSNKVRTRRY